MMCVEELTILSIARLSYVHEIQGTYGTHGVDEVEIYHGRMSRLAFVDIVIPHQFDVLETFQIRKFDTIA